MLAVLLPTGPGCGALPGHGGDGEAACGEVRAGMMGFRLEWRVLDDRGRAATWFEDLRLDTSAVPPAWHSTLRDEDGAHLDREAVGRVRHRFLVTAWRLAEEEANRGPME